MVIIYYIFSCFNYGKVQGATLGATFRMPIRANLDH
uniref:Uncharacterized protein n=1 Tax=Podoviridae sp. ctlSr7 TaxID=2826573 RepID=A0A8S5MXM0_9CAUD|nr:MAG TPA: hypothetical protein [Podoviridae sp. ctlSr7]